MNKTLTIALAVAALAASLPLVVAGSFKDEPVTAAAALPPYEVLTTLRIMGLDPIGEPARRGPYYVLHAYDPSGVEVRVVADAQFGDILSISPAKALQNIYTPHYERGPRIIHVPRPGERRSHADVKDRDEVALPDDDTIEVAPRPRRRVTRPAQHHSSAPPPPADHRTVLSVPPPHAVGLTPIRPTPRFDAKSEKGEKFATPDDRPAAATALAPPVGYTPPAGMPKAE